MEQNNITKNFIHMVDTLLDKGIIKNYAELVEKLSWNKSVMSNVMNGKMNVPLHIHAKLKATYEIAEPDTSTDHFKDKYFELLEKYTKLLEDHVELQAKLITDIKSLAV